MINKWERVEFANIPIYISQNIPDWFIPNNSADKVLSNYLIGEKIDVDTASLLKRIETTNVKDYTSRSEVLSLDSLKECWIHITNRCNLTCKHCMFSSSPTERDELSPETCAKVIQDSYDLGCRLFFFTGGEPFLSKVFIEGVEDILQRHDTHVVVLTNLTLVSKHKNWLEKLPKERLHFQVSLDGLQENHDALRGKGAFDTLKKNLAILRELDFPTTLSITVTADNVGEMEGIVDFVSTVGVTNLHFLWLFKKGNADDSLMADIDSIFNNLTAAQVRGEKVGVKIDNIETLRSQVLSCPGTRYDLTNAGWQSLAVGPDGYIYPTPALIYTEEMRCGYVKDGVENVWRNSKVLNDLRKASLTQSDEYKNNPFHYIIGGGDIDHSYIAAKKLTGGDPYVELYTRLAQWLMTQEAAPYNPQGYPAIRLKMGEKLGECPTEGGDIFFTHSNCLLSLSGHDTHTQINHFYSEAAEETKEDILNPVCYDEKLISHIPEDMRYRSYGCGSPVIEAKIKEGETIVDLGSGTGIECFIASKLTGASGQVIGLDMGDKMLQVANRGKEGVVNNLGYNNLTFKKSFLENIPLEDNSVDVVISNCVLNLSPNKRRVFQEIFRILKPNGRLVISDITYNDDIPLDIKYNETLRGECIGGALKYHDLFGLLNDLGFSESKIAKGYHYREVKGYSFYSVTYQAFKREAGIIPTLYDFPDFNGLMDKVKSEPTCSCFVTPKENEEKKQAVGAQHKGDCIVCGSELVYLETNQDKKCHYCEIIIPANAECKNGHFVCDSCHCEDGLEIIRQVCLNSSETDVVTLMQTIRSHPNFKIHGPEHHAMVPAIILTSLRNSGNDISDTQIETAIQRGSTVAGGACAFLGACGAALGIGIAFAVLSEANPLNGTKRQESMLATQAALEKISSFDAPRCCQRDCLLAIQIAAKLLKEKLGINLSFDGNLKCDQFTKNRECIYDKCPFWDK